MARVMARQGRKSKTTSEKRQEETGVSGTFCLFAVSIRVGEEVGEISGHFSS